MKPPSESSKQLESGHQEISQINAALHKARTRLPFARKLRVDIEGCLGAEKAALKLATANIRHMRLVADHVVLKEWLEVSLIAEAKTETVYRKQAELAQITAEIEYIEATIPELETQKKLLVDRVSALGQVIHLKIK